MTRERQVRLIDHLRRLGMSNRDARKQMGSGKVLYRGVPTADGGRSVLASQVRVDPRAPRIQVGRDPMVLFKDKHLAVVWKPPGMLSVAAPRRGREPNLVSEAARILGVAQPVHRLDEGTSGLMLVARTKMARAGLIALLSPETPPERKIARRYLALVDKTFPEGPPRTIDATILEDAGGGRRGVGPGGVVAVTHVKRRQTLLRSASLVEARLDTGRTHQIRIHLASLGFPVLGDARYGDARVARRAHRLALHAYHLGFTHPMTGQKVVVEAPLADDLEHLRRTLDAPKRRPA